MKVLNYSQFKNQQLNESWKDVLLGSILAIQSLSSPAQKRIPLDDTIKNGDVGGITWTAHATVTPHDNRVIRTGQGGVHDDFSRRREIDYQREWDEDTYAQQNGRIRNPHWEYDTHTSSENYSNLFNQLLNDLDSVDIDDPNLNIIKNYLKWGNQKDNLNIPKIVENLKKFAENRKIQHVSTVFDGLYKYDPKDLKSLSETDADLERARLLRVLSDVKSLIDDEESVAYIYNWHFKGWVFKIFVVIATLVLLYQLLRLIDYIAQRRANRQEVLALDDITPR